MEPVTVPSRVFSAPKAPDQPSTARAHTSARSEKEVMVAGGGMGAELRREHRAREVADRLLRARQRGIKIANTTPIKPGQGATSQLWFAMSASDGLRYQY